MEMLSSSRYRSYLLDHKLGNTGDEFDLRRVFTLVLKANLIPSCDIIPTGNNVYHCWRRVVFPPE